VAGLDLVRRAATAPGVRRLTTVTPVIRATGALRGTLVREPRRFALNEMRVRGVAARYTLRDGGRPIVIRHHTSDVMILDEIFSAGEYDLPPAVAAILDGLPRPRVVDLGANIGLFGVWLLTRKPDATIVAYEPDPGNAAVHARVIELNDAADRWTLRAAAAATAPGTLTFLSGLGSTSRALDDGVAGGPEGRGEGETVTVPAVDAFDDLGACDLAKIDIEGGEWALLADERFGRLPAAAVFVEYHPHGCPGDDPGAEAEQLVRAAGYAVHHAPKDIPGYGVVWGWRA
jgi:FkbM family methyltransferase